MSLDTNGFETHHGFLGDKALVELISEIDNLDASFPKHGLRNAHQKMPSINQLVKSRLLMDKAQQFLLGKPRLVRVILFDKTSAKNWLVAWHQDKTIAVNTKTSVDGWGPWTLKDGVHHVQPDAAVLQQMITFRIHLDNANEENGCLKVFPKSHNLGILNQTDIDSLVVNSKPEYCVADAGDLLVMWPLLLHSSGKGTVPSHRRVLHIEYSDYELPDGLQWVS